jgi:protein PhnA
MSIESDLQTRSGGQCELCSTRPGKAIYDLSRDGVSEAETSVVVCGKCAGQIRDPEKMDVHHWRCLSDAMWSETQAVQVMAWRMLDRLSGEGWAQELLDQLYLDDETLAWARAAKGSEDAEPHLDSNGAALASGDTVTLIKDLNVKGTSFTAKRGTAVRGISLVEGNTAQIEGRVNGQQIVILTEFVKKTG